jgi:hypothetical protein
MKEFYLRCIGPNSHAGFSPLPGLSVLTYQRLTSASALTLKKNLFYIFQVSVFFTENFYD